MTKEDVEAERRFHRYAVVLSVRLPVTLLEKLDKLVGADRNPRVRSAAIRLLLERYVEEKENLPEPKPEVVRLRK